MSCIMNSITFKYSNSNDLMLMLLLLLAKRMGIEAVEPTAKKPNGAKMAAALSKLAQINAFSSIKDPVKWQRKNRKDRKLPNR